MTPFILGMVLATLIACWFEIRWWQYEARVWEELAIDYRNAYFKEIQRP